MYEEHSTQCENDHDDKLTKGEAWCLYLSHFLSIWNSRTYEYGAILFIQSAFAGNLLPSSINGIAETVCVIITSSTLGSWVDESPTRLRPLLLSIFANRITLVACCILWVLLFLTVHENLRKVLFAAILALGMVEKSSRMTNILSMERDWVPTLANTDGEEYSLTHMNTIMRRIDIACKFLAPLAISEAVVLIRPAPAAVAIATVSSVSLGLEFWTAMRVWKNNSRLRIAKGEKPSITGDFELDQRYQPELQASQPDANILQNLLTKGEYALAFGRSIIRDHTERLYYYFSTPVWVPSMCVAALHASVLAWSGTFITWLLNANFSVDQITVAKGIGSIFEIASTWAFPWAVSVFSMTQSKGPVAASYQMVEGRSVDDEDEEGDGQAQGSLAKVMEQSQFIGSRTLHAGVVKAAQWAVISQLTFLFPTMIALFYLNSRLTDEHLESGTSPLGAQTTFAIVFLVFLSFSFLGRWTYDLAVTQLTQMLIPAAHRSSFGGMEQAIVSCLSLVHWVAAAIWHQEKDFVWLALGSFCAVAVATGAFTWWTRTWMRSVNGLYRLDQG